MCIQRDRKRLLNSVLLFLGRNVEPVETVEIVRENKEIVHFYN